MIRNIEPTVTRSGTATLLITTACCGAKVYANTIPICPMCGEPIGTEVHTTERNLDHLVGTALTRYWS